jgi:hypothetical protein
MSTTSSSSEAEILRRAIDPYSRGLSVESLSSVDFAPDDHERMRQLAARAREGTLGDDEWAILHQYELVGDLLGILRSKARISLKQTGVSPD